MKETKYKAGDRVVVTDSDVCYGSYYNENGEFFDGPKLQGVELEVVEPVEGWGGFRVVLPNGSIGILFDYEVEAVASAQ